MPYDPVRQMRRSRAPCKGPGRLPSSVRLTISVRVPSGRRTRYIFGQSVSGDDGVAAEGHCERMVATRIVGDD